IPANLDITPQLAEAVRLLESARQTGRPVAELLAQTDLDRPPPSPEAEGLLRLMFHDDAMRRPVGRARFADVLRAYVAQAVDVQPGPDMFGTPPATAAGILAAVA